VLFSIAAIAFLGDISNLSAAASTMFLSSENPSALSSRILLFNASTSLFAEADDKAVFFALRDDFNLLIAGADLVIAADTPAPSTAPPPAVNAVAPRSISPSSANPLVASYAPPKAPLIAATDFSPLPTGDSVVGSTNAPIKAPATPAIPVDSPLSALLESSGYLICSTSFLNSYHQH
jgi:hypothetical protein